MRLLRSIDFNTLNVGGLKNVRFVQVVIKSCYREIALLEGVIVITAFTYANNIQGGKSTQSSLRSTCKSKCKIPEKIDRIVIRKFS